MKMDTKERGETLQPNLHDEYQPIFRDVDIRFEEAVEVHRSICLISTLRLKFQFRSKYDGSD